MDKKSPVVEVMDSDHAWAAAVELVLPAHHAVVLQEIAAAITQYPQDAGVLISGIDLLGPTHPSMRNTDLYRCHCREILTRVAAGTDTRPGTAAEVCAACSVTSLGAPFALPLSGSICGCGVWRDCRRSTASPAISTITRTASAPGSMSSRR